jgi:hypothetical protein
MTTEVASPALDAVRMRESLGTSTVEESAFQASSVLCSRSSSRNTVPAVLPRPASALSVTTWYLLPQTVLICSLPDFMLPRDIRGDKIGFSRASSLTAVQVLNASPRFWAAPRMRS